MEDLIWGTEGRGALVLNYLCITTKRQRQDEIGGTLGTLTPLAQVENVKINSAKNSEFPSSNKVMIVPKPTAGSKETNRGIS